MDLARSSDSGGEGSVGDGFITNAKKTRTMLINLLYPQRCPVCGEPAGELLQEEYPTACVKCRGRVPLIQEPYCLHCGKQLEGNEREYCYDCAKHPENSALTRGLAAFAYREPMKQSMYLFKNGRREYADYYAGVLVERYEDIIRSWDAEVIIPVPLHPAKYRKRGYNQSEELAKALGRRLGIPVRTDLLQKTKNTGPQKSLNEKERKNNAKNSFHLGQSILVYRKIILCDDIYTTGMTLNACAEPLREAGADEIYFLTACVGHGY